MTDSPTKGVLATSVRGVDDLAEQLGRRGWHVGVVSGAPSRKEALDAIGRALDFPDYYGRNLDALADCLTDLTRPHQKPHRRKIMNIKQKHHSHRLTVFFAVLNISFFSLKTQKN